ncbi:unnamed protein product, partial [Oppiella nova]
MTPTLALCLLLAVVPTARACLCQLKQLQFRCSSATCYNERVANDFCRSDFCVEASVRSDRQYTGQQLHHNVTYATYQFRPVRVLRFTPASLLAIKTSTIYTPSESAQCGVQLKKGSIYFFCGQMLGQKAVLTACHYVKRTETLNLAERSFFISGYKKTNCQPSSHEPFRLPAYGNASYQRPPTPKPPIAIHALPTLASPKPIVAANFIPTVVQKPVSPITLPTLKPTPNATTTTTTTTKASTTSATTGKPDPQSGPPGPPGSPANGDYFCLLVPINALSLNRFLKYLTSKEGFAVDSSGQYVLYCPNQFFCIPQTSQLTALQNITALEVLSVADKSAEMERQLAASTEDFKALMPKPLLPMCKDFNETTFIVAPWLVSALSVLQPPEDTSEVPPPCSDTNVEVDCDFNATVTLADGTTITASPLQEPPLPTTIATPDGTAIAITVGQASRVTAADGTEAVLALDGSSRTLLPDGTVVAIGVDQNVSLNMSDGASVVFNAMGMTVTLPDGTRVQTSEYGMVVTTPEGKNTLIPVDSNGAEVHSSGGSEVVVTEGLNAEIRAKSGTQVLITPTDTTIGGRDGGTTNIMPDGTVTVTAPGGLSLVFAVDAYVNVTTSDGTAASMGQDDSLYVINENVCIVVFPNGNEMIVTKDEIISLESDGSVT